MSLESTPNSTPNNDNKSFTDKFKKKIAPYLMAGVTAISGGGALASEKSVDQGPQNTTNIEMASVTLPPVSPETFSPDNYKIVNDAITVLNEAISDFKYSVEKDQVAIEKRIDEVLPKINKCIVETNKITDKNLAESCSRQVTHIRDLLKMHRKSKDGKVWGYAQLNDVVQVRDIFRTFVDLYNVSYKNAHESEEEVETKSK